MSFVAYAMFWLDTSDFRPHAVTKSKDNLDLWETYQGKVKHKSRILRLKDSTGSYQIQWVLHDCKISNTTIIGPPAFVNDTPEPSTAISCTCGEYAATGYPCMCMEAAQISRGGNPHDLYPLRVTARRWYDQYHAHPGNLHGVTLEQVDQIYDMFPPEKKTGLQTSVVGPRGPGRPKGSQRHEQPWKVKLSKGKRKSKSKAAIARQRRARAAQLNGAQTRVRAPSMSCR